MCPQNTTCSAIPEREYAFYCTCNPGFNFESYDSKTPNVQICNQNTSLNGTSRMPDKEIPISESAIIFIVVIFIGVLVILLLGIILTVILLPIRRLLTKQENKVGTLLESNKTPISKKY